MGVRREGLAEDAAWEGARAAWVEALYQKEGDREGGGWPLVWSPFEGLRQKHR